MGNQEHKFDWQRWMGMRDEWGDNRDPYDPAVGPTDDDFSDPLLEKRPEDDDPTLDPILGVDFEWDPDHLAGDFGTPYEPMLDECVRRVNTWLADLCMGGQVLVTDEEAVEGVINHNWEARLILSMKVGWNPEYPDQMSWPMEVLEPASHGENFFVTVTSTTFKIPVHYVESLGAWQMMAHKMLNMFLEENPHISRPSWLPKHI